MISENQIFVQQHMPQILCVKEYLDNYLIHIFVHCRKYQEFKSKYDVENLLW